MVDSVVQIALTHGGRESSNKTHKICILQIVSFSVSHYKPQKAGRLNACTRFFRSDGWGDSVGGDLRQDVRRGASCQAEPETKHQRGGGQRLPGRRRIQQHLRRNLSFVSVVLYE